MKAAVKRKQGEPSSNCDDAVKHQRWSDSLAINDVILTDPSTDRFIERSAQDNWTETKTKATELRLLLERERKQSDHFEAYLSQALSSQSPPPSDQRRVLTQESVLNGSDRQYSLTEKISQLQSSLLSEREADRLFELQLLQICLYD